MSSESCLLCACLLGAELRFMQLAVDAAINACTTRTPPMLFSIRALNSPISLNIRRNAKIILRLKYS